jgi:bacillithiol biosynthesis cysteine-adding enzyme BshC
LCLLELPPRDEQRVSVQEARVSTEINELLSRIQAELGHHQHTAWVLGLLEKHYLPGARLSEAFSGFLAEMTAPHGLLIFNPRDELSRGIGKGVFSWAYEQRQKIHDRLLDSAARLASQGIKPQVALRSDSPLFFFHPQGADGPRVRLSENGDSWSMIGADGSVSDEHLRAALVENPGQFSTSALLRPILQDALFPTAAYLGGPAERRYFEQLLPVYSLRPYPAPCILPRPSLLLLDEKVRRYLTSLNLPLSSLMASEDEAQAQLAKSLVGNFPIPDEMEKSSRQTASAAFAPYREVFSKLDRSLLKPLEKAEQKTLSSLSSFKERYIRILLDHNSQQAERLIKVRNLIRPRGEPQERQLCALYYLCRYGQGFIEHLLEKVKLFCEEEQRIEL